MKFFCTGQFDAIIHFAAFIEVFESTQEPLKYYLNNTANVAKNFNVLPKIGVNKFVFSSTAAVYGEPDVPEVTEQSAANPINPYGRSKLMSEQIIKDYALANPMQFAILRYFNVAGADEEGLIGQNYPNATHLIKIATQTALGKRASMSIFGDDYATKDGTCVRDYIHVSDLADAHLSALEFLNERGESEIFNVGYGRGFSVKEVVEVAKKVSGVNFKVEHAPRRTAILPCSSQIRASYARKRHGSQSETILNLSSKPRWNGRKRYENSSHRHRIRGAS